MLNMADIQGDPALNASKHKKGYTQTKQTSLALFPWVIQYTKRDMPQSQILSIEELQTHLNEYHVPYIEAIPPKGIGVLETFDAILQRVGITREYAVE
jgi:hypothetical protein